MNSFFSLVKGVLLSNGLEEIDQMLYIYMYGALKSASRTTDRTDCAFPQHVLLKPVLHPVPVGENSYIRFPD
jgi:hypothetical protein